MTSSVCASVATGTEGTLIDTRDNTVYQVGKMLDGKCWMLQNLALGNTSGATALTSTNSNVGSDWSLPAAYASVTGGGGSDPAAIQSWNFGKWVLATPLLTEGCGSLSDPNLANCTKVGFVNVSDTSKFQPTYTATTRSWDGVNAADNTLITVNCTSWSGSGTSRTCAAGTYDPHYLVGNYYTWNAATAGTGGSITSGQASGSICPKGWKLPTSENSDTLGSFYGLLYQYRVHYNLSGTVNGTTYNIAGAPLRFVRSGYVQAHSVNGRVQNTGQSGYYWSSTPGSSSSNAAILAFYNSSVQPYGAGIRLTGYSVRCISQ